MPLGGAVSDVNIHGRPFSVAADADTQRDLGGSTIELSMNGNGTSRPIVTVKPWMVEGLTLSINEDNEDQEYLQDIVDRHAEGPIDITYADGVTYSGSGTITGDLKWSSQNATADIVLSGGGKLTKQ